jgi:hypothetical protein
MIVSLDRLSVNDNLQVCFESLCAFLEAKLGLPSRKTTETATTTTEVPHNVHHHAL